MPYFQWAFASYIENAGGCDYIQDIVCDAVNIQAVKAYIQTSSNEKYQKALSCLESKCGFSTTSSTYRYVLLKSRNNYMLKMTTFTLLGLIVAAAGMFSYKKCMKAKNDGSYDLHKDDTTVTSTESRPQISTFEAA